MIVESDKLYDGDWSAMMASMLDNWCRTSKHSIIKISAQNRLSDILQQVNKISKG